MVWTRDMNGVRLRREGVRGCFLFTELRKELVDQGTIFFLLLAKNILPVFYLKNAFC